VVSYAQTNYSFTTEVAISAISPVVTGGTPAQWAISPALPAGLNFSTTTGAISGSPTQAAAAAPFAVTASNAGGASTFNLTIAVKSGTLLELGHANNVLAIRYEGTRVLSRDGRGTWALWNADGGERIAGGGLNCTSSCESSIALAGNTAVIASDTTIRVLSAIDGTALWDAPLPPGTWWTLASDGGYLAFGDIATLTVRSRAGSTLFQIAGDFAVSSAFAAAAELRLAKGPAGSNIIQRVAIPAGTSTNSAGFQGTFHSWFKDGSRFIANLGTTVWVYSIDGVQQGSGTLSALGALFNLGGNGDKVWYRSGWDLRAFTFAPTLTEVAAFTLPSLAGEAIFSGNTLGIPTGNSDTVSVIDLAPSTPTLTTVTAPIAQVTAYAATSATNPVFGNAKGAMFRDVSGPTAPQLYSRGHVRSIAGSTTRFAISFSSSDVNYYDANTGTLQGVIELPSSGSPGFYRLPTAKLALSRDGNTLAVGQVSNDGLQSRVTLYSLPSESLIHEFTFDSPDDLIDFSMSGSGDVLSFKTGVLPGSGVSTLQVVQSDGMARYTNASFAGDTPVFSPSGAKAAYKIYPLDVGSTSRVIDGNTLAGTLPGWVSGWLEEQRLIVNTFILMPPNFITFNGARIVDPQGAVIASTPIPRIDYFEVVSANQIYAPQLNEIRDLTSGNPVWTSASTDPSPGERMGTVAGNNVVFTTGSRVRIEPRP
jgi:putative Ig domain-containing protein